MDAVRCLDCADVRWSLLGMKGPAGRCELCGGELVPERRRPGAAGPAPGERRELMVARAGARAPEPRPSA